MEQQRTHVSGTSAAAGLAVVKCSYSDQREFFTLEGIVDCDKPLPVMWP